MDISGNAQCKVGASQVEPGQWLAKIQCNARTKRNRPIARRPQYAVDMQPSLEAMLPDIVVKKLCKILDALPHVGGGHEHEHTHALDILLKIPCRRNGP